jgi:hypothetical protein
MLRGRHSHSLPPAQSLAKDLTEAEEQYAHALRSHLHNIDQLLTLQRRRLGLLEENYNMELEVLTKEFETERYGGQRVERLDSGEFSETTPVTRYPVLRAEPLT